MPVSPFSTFPRKRGKGQSNRYAGFTLKVMQNLFQGRKILVLPLLALLLLLVVWMYRDDTKPVIKIGVLHSLTGTMAVSESPLVDAVRLAVEEANQSGGVNGAQIEMIVTDCRSDAGYCAQQAEKLLGATI